MVPYRVTAVVLGWTLLTAGPALAQGGDDGKTDKTIEALAKQAKPSIAVITVTGRDGKERGLGTGFVVSADGLIATNLHVIGEARPIWVQLGKTRFAVTAVHASDRTLDL